MYDVEVKNSIEQTFFTELDPTLNTEEDLATTGKIETHLHQIESLSITAQKFNLLLVLQELIELVARVTRF